MLLLNIKYLQLWRLPFMLTNKESLVLQDSCREAEKYNVVSDAEIPTRG